MIERWQARVRAMSLLAGLALLALALLGLQYGASTYVQRVAVDIGIMIILTVSLNLSNGYTGVFSLGHTGFMALGAYGSALLTMTPQVKALNLPDLPAWLAHVHLGFLPALVLVGLAAAAVALAVGYPILRLTGPYVAVATLGFLVIVHIVIINAQAYTRGARTFLGLAPLTNLWWVYGAVVVTIYTAWRIVNSPIGRAMLAVREDPVAARGAGVDILRARLWSFAVSAFFTAVAGALWAHFILAFSASSFWFAVTFEVIVMLIVGGLGSISGSVAATVALSILSEVLRNAERGVTLFGYHTPALYGLSQIVFALVFIAFIVYRPQGLFGDREFSLWPILARWYPPLREAVMAGRQLAE
ncbi:MAG: branched-chain amino acid ABC transporter permease [Firmicutes bacterium]|nr:branched-chain amino acid ABC transporter permease [Bacillota bacterium]